MTIDEWLLIGDGRSGNLRPKGIGSINHSPFAPSLAKMARFSLARGHFETRDHLSLCLPTGHRDED
ncbi:MAG TPA: hypothetical protein VF509_08710 [Sphingobium sp.]